MPQREQLTAGEPFNPWHDECGFYPPDIVGSNRSLGLTPGQKRLYERCVRWAGRKGSFWHSFVTIAQALGKSVRQTKHDMSVLEQTGLIRHARRQRKSNLYVFLFHAIFDGQSTAHQNGDLDGQPPALQSSRLEVQSNVSLEVQRTAQESCPLNYVNDESSSSEYSKRKTQDEDPPVSEEVKPVDVEISRVVEAIDHLRKARAVDVGIPLDKQAPPDREIALKILGSFQSFEDFRFWLKTTVDRHLARKATSPRWGLYATDAANHSQDIALKRERAEKDEIDAEIRWQHRQALEADAERTMKTPMPAQDALRLVLSRVDRIPQLLKARLERTGELISPNELARQVRNWKSCPHCRDGILGNAIDRNLRFCGCEAGTEAIHRDGQEYPERQIKLVHADIKSLLVAGCHDVRSPFTADAIAEANVTDDGETLEIHLLGTGARNGIPERHVKAVLDRVGLERRIMIHGGPRPGPVHSIGGAAPRRAAAPPQADFDAIVRCTPMQSVTDSRLKN